MTSAPAPPMPNPTDVVPLPRELRCEYPSKFCNNHKAEKQKGDLHKFCEFHRRKANMNQKRWQQRRREQRLLKRDRMAEATAIANSTHNGFGALPTPAASHVVPTAMGYYAFAPQHVVMPPLQLTRAMSTNLQDDEIETLNSILWADPPAPQDDWCLMPPAFSQDSVAHKLEVHADPSASFSVVTHGVAIV
ncbi:hypothetical protein PINS_up003255 [Pythium insidiosum]|nr:hypothetical protein PINS_up003255 [Pythium insidiosum]